MRRLVASLLVVGALAGCDARPSVTLRALGVTRSPDWMKEDCRPITDEAILTVPSSRYWTCHTRTPLGRFRVDWWLGTAVAGERGWPVRDSLAWERAQDSTARALAAFATSRPCTRREPDASPPIAYAIRRSRVWAVKGERRWVGMRSQWLPGYEPAMRGLVVVSTDTGEVDPCMRARAVDFSRFW